MFSLPSKILNWGFRRYVRRFVRRNFNAVRVAEKRQVEQLPTGPVVCFVNHPGWWDPMTAVVITDQLFPGRRFAAPMDAEALSRYPILELLGFFPVARDTVIGAKEFLRTSRELLKSPETILWLSPTGRFNDVRQTAPFMHGLSHLVDREFAGSLFPMAIEYTFWNERSPELLVRFGSPVACSALSAERDIRTLELEQALAGTQASLAELAIARNPTAFTTLSVGRAGVGGLYDLWRRLAAGFRGQKFRDRHQHEPVTPAGSVHGEVT